jgi:hypothetical protein
MSNLIGVDIVSFGSANDLGIERVISLLLQEVSDKRNYNPLENIGDHVTTKRTTSLS